MQDFYTSPFDTYYLTVWFQSPDKLRFAPRSSLTKHIVEEIKAHKAQIIDVLKSLPPCSCGSSDWRYEPLAYDEAGGFVCRKCFHARHINVNIENLFEDIVHMELIQGADMPIESPESPPDICAQCGAKRSIDIILGLSETGIWLCSKCYYSKKKRKSKKKAAL